ncbi:MAG: GYDIA family GHMP kinase [Flavobacteriaceae bacterium]|nr:GHMP kinase [Flavobacteriaceae bacterium]
MKTFYSNGKLLLTGEYVVLDGALSLAIPTKKGQSLTVEESNEKGIHWKSLDAHGMPWFEAQFQLGDTVEESENKTLFQLIKILKEARKRNPSFLVDANIQVTTQLSFPQNWGLGTSSTLLNNIAQWAKINPFQLLKDSFGGSGYDIAAANYNTPILYQLKNGKPIVKENLLEWKFTDNLFFVYLNKKQNSREAIAKYKSKSLSSTVISEISTLTRELVACKSIHAFEELLIAHETIISKTILLPTVKETLFVDYPHAMKSLGAWGGDFILAVGTEEHQAYFRKKGYSTIIPFKEMLL